MTQLTPQETPSLESVIISTAELRRRPSRAPDYAAENHVLVALAREMAVAPNDRMGQRAAAAGALAVLRKPVNHEELSRSVREALGEQ